MWRSRTARWETGPALRELITKAQAAKGGVHLMGLLSPGGVHSHQDHMAALVKILAEARLPVFVHAFLDGRDTPPRSARGFIEKFLKDIEGAPGVRMATVSGRYYAMDRDKRWDRVKKDYDALVDADAPRYADIFAALDASYAENVNDEFVVPAVLGDYAGMADGDALLFANFRADRAREISLALLDKGFTGFERSRMVKFAAATGMTEYSEQLAAMMTAIFPARGCARDVGRSDGRARLETAAHRRDREIRPCHFLPEWRARGAFSRRGPHPGAQPQSLDL